MSGWNPPIAWRWKPPTPIPVGALLVVKAGREHEVLPKFSTIIYLGWDTVKGGMKILFSDGKISTHYHEDILENFEEVNPCASDLSSC